MDDRAFDTLWESPARVHCAQPVSRLWPTLSPRPGRGRKVRPLGGRGGLPWRSDDGDHRFHASGPPSTPTRRTNSLDRRSPAMRHAGMGSGRASDSRITVGHHRYGTRPRLVPAGRKRPLAGVGSRLTHPPVSAQPFHDRDCPMTVGGAVRVMGPMTPGLASA